MADNDSGSDSYTHVLREIGVRLSVGKNKKSFKTLFCAFASQDVNVKRFHEKCDAKGPTLTILHGKHNTIFGGYTSKNWTSGKTHTEKDGEAFLFYMHDHEGAKCTFLPIKDNKKDMAITCDPNFGPTFGVKSLRNNYDLQVFKKDSKSESKDEETKEKEKFMHLNGKLNIGHAYDSDTTKVKNRDINSGKLIVKKIEVLQVIDDEMPVPWREKRYDFETMKKKLEMIEPVGGLGLKSYNILLIGAVGAGKSSFYNSLATVFARNVIAHAPARVSSVSSVTNEIKAYNIVTENGGELCVRIFDIRGFEFNRGYEHELDWILDGKLPIGYKFPEKPMPIEEGRQEAGTLNEQIHLLCFVTGTSGNFSKGLIPHIKAIKCSADKKGLPMVVVATKIDKQCENVTEDVDHLYKCIKSRDAVSRISEDLDIQENHILPVVNYTTDKRKSKGKDRLAIEALYTMVELTKEYLEKHTDMVNKVDEFEERGLRQSPKAIGVAGTVRGAAVGGVVSGTATSAPPEEHDMDVNGVLFSDGNDDSIVQTFYGKVRVKAENPKAMPREDLLKNSELDRLSSTQGITSQVVMEECDKICAYIKARSDKIVHVWPAYKVKTETNIVFVVIAKEKVTLDLSWKYEVRIVNQYAAESKSMMYCKDSSLLPSAVSRTIGEIIDKNSLQLMQNHAYLSVISASSVISKGYGTSNHCIIAKPCIVLSVLAKHYIPINEEPFPTEIHGIPVDVRECEFEFCGRSAEAFHDKVKMGCKISSTFLPQKHGTLGGFVEHPEYGLCGITCAHVVLNDDMKFELKAKANVKEKELNCCEIFQPFNDPQKQNVIGKLVEVTYKEGGNGTAGVDLALFKLHQRQPTDRTFPDCKSASTIRYESGNVWGQSGIPSDQRKVLKYGFVTGLTYGNIQFENAVVREMDFHSKIEVNKGAEKYTTTLYKQYHIKSDDKNLKFSELGDSGALVFMKEGLDEESELRCIGMVVGVFSDDTCAVTPITAILKELHVSQLKMFLPNITWEKIESRFRKMEERLMNIEKLVEKALANRNNQSQ